ncbi:MAG: hypothetical protein HC915_10820 [Anaerolineae bacterium]|nr:hypothetical protein [Anaerolineae bacterium]
MLDVNLKVFVVESDIYARYAIASYLGWDRRTRVSRRLGSLAELEDTLLSLSEPEKPDAILLDDTLLPTARDARQSISGILAYAPATMIVLAHTPRLEIAQAVQAGHGAAYVLREEVGLGIS